MMGKMLLALALLAGMAPGSGDPSPGIPPAMCALPDAAGPTEAFHVPLPESAAPVDAPAYYAFPVVSTRRLPGTGLAAGWAR